MKIWFEGCVFLVALLGAVTCGQQKIGARIDGRRDGMSTNVASTAAEPMALRISLRSYLEHCARIALSAPRRTGNLVLATLDMSFKGSVADCGCKSASLVVRSVNRIDEEENELAKTIIAAPLQGPVTRRLDVVVAGDLLPTAQDQVILHVGCEPPR